MVAVFRRLIPNAGMDEAKGYIHAGIIVPLGGSNIVALEGGAGLQVGSRFRPAIQVDELNANEVLTALDMVYNFSPFDATGLNLALLRTQILQASQSTRLRVFKITGNNLAGLNGTVEAVDPKAPRAQPVTLACYVFDKKPVTVAYRQVQVRDEQGKWVPSSSVPFDAKAMKDGMNAIWTPQANVVISLGRTDAVQVQGLTAKSDWAEMANLRDELVKKKDPTADFTMFLVKAPRDNGLPVAGVTNPQLGFCLVDGKEARTGAHELGHFLGSLSEKGKFSQVYGDKDKNAEKDLLMLSGGGGARIPFNDVPRFNYGYRK